MTIRAAIPQHDGSISPGRENVRRCRVHKNLQQKQVKQDGCVCHIREKGGHDFLTSSLRWISFYPTSFLSPTRLCRSETLELSLLWQLNLSWIKGHWLCQFPDPQFANGHFESLYPCQCGTVAVSWTSRKKPSLTVSQVQNFTLDQEMRNQRFCPKDPRPPSPCTTLGGGMSVGGGISLGGLTLVFTWLMASGVASRGGGETIGLVEPGLLHFCNASRLFLRQRSNNTVNWTKLNPTDMKWDVSFLNSWFCTHKVNTRQEFLLQRGSDESCIHEWFRCFLFNKGVSCRNIFSNRWKEACQSWKLRRKKRVCFSLRIQRCKISVISMSEAQHQFYNGMS